MVYTTLDDCCFDCEVPTGPSRSMLSNIVVVCRSWFVLFVEGVRSGKKG